MTQPSQEKKAQKYYNNYSKTYEGERRHGYYSLINDLEFEKIEPYASGKKTLEIGCGTGLILERTHKVAENARGVDISDGMLEVCKKKGLNVQKASAADLPFEDNSFDLTYSFKVLAHIPEIERVMKEITRVTKPGGRMILEFYNPYSFKGINDKVRILFKRGNPVYLRHDSLKKIKSYLPESVYIVSTRSARTWRPIAACYTTPILSGLFRFLDRISCDSFINCLGGYFIVEMVSDKA